MWRSRSHPEKEPDVVALAPGSAIEIAGLSFSGYARADGQVGIRNRLLVLFTVVCAEEISRRIAYQVEDAVIAGWRDCNANAGGRQKMLRLAANPNVGSVLVLSLGCESTDAPAIVEQ